MKYYRGGFEVTIKADQTPVTQADREAEQAIRGVLGRASPGAGFLGEEFGEEGSTTYRWIIDPIDGTKNFVRRIPFWAVLIGLEEDGQIDHGRGAQSQSPASSSGRARARGRGPTASASASPRVAVLEGRDADALEPQPDQERRLLGRVRSPGRRAPLASEASATTTATAWWLRVKAELYAEADLKPWDAAPMKILIEEAGGRLTDFEGKPDIYTGSVLASNGLLHDEALRLLRRA